MPELKGAEYLLSHIKTIGFYSNSGMGISPISFQEIKSYCELTGLEFTPSEILTMKQMSSEYVAQSHDKNPMAKRPYKPEVIVKKKNNFIESLRKIAVKK